MKCIDVIKSKVDQTVKYVFESDGNILEFSYINKKDGKDIVVAPTQTACNLGCKFCFLSGLKLPVRNLTPTEMTCGIMHVVNELEDKQNVLLVSFMGCGEPLLNVDNVMHTMVAIRALYGYYYSTVRFAVASLIPTEKSFRSFMAGIQLHGLPCKFHYSLHTVDRKKRKILMPAAADFEKIDAFNLLRHYTITSSTVEVHYSLMHGINDSDKDAECLATYLIGNPVIPIKFLKLSEKEGDIYYQSKRIAGFRRILEAQGIPTEYYEPPGSDVGSSCGQFLLDYYEKYNGNKDNS